MTMFSFLDIENAFMYVSSAMYGMNSAVVCKDTGKILYRSDMAGIDEIEDEDHLDWEQCIEIPHKNDLDLGRNLAFEFVEEYLPDDYERVLEMFRRRGAYSRYKALLERRGLLKEWYDIENSREERALRKWCKENEIELDGQQAGAVDALPNRPSLLSNFFSVCRHCRFTIEPLTRQRYLEATKA